VEGYAAAARAVSEQAPRVASEMDPQAVSNTLWAISELRVHLNCKAGGEGGGGGCGGGAGDERADAARGG
jgi:hypothetical protein